MTDWSFIAEFRNCRNFRACDSRQFTGVYLPCRRRACHCAIASIMQTANAIEPHDIIGPARRVYADPFATSWQAAYAGRLIQIANGAPRGRSTPPRWHTRVSVRVGAGRTSVRLRGRVRADGSAEWRVRAHPAADLEQPDYRVDSAVSASVYAECLPDSKITRPRPLLLLYSAIHRNRPHNRPVHVSHQSLMINDQMTLPRPEPSLNNYLEIVWFDELAGHSGVSIRAGTIHAAKL